AIGLISLHSSNLAPISNFGLYSAIGVIATLAILFSYLPASLQTFAPSFFDDNLEDTNKSELSTTHEEGWLSDAWAAVGRWITGHHALVATVSMVVLITASFGLAKIQTSVQLLKLFDPESRIIRDYAWMEANFGKLVPMELIVRVPPSMQSERVTPKESDDDAATPPSDQQLLTSTQSLSMLKRAEAISRINTVVRRTLGEPGLGVVGQAMSADTFMPPLPAPSNGYHVVRAKFNRDLIAGRDELLDSDYVRIEKDGPFKDSELWRISLRVGALSDTDYGYFIATLRTAVEPVLRAYDTREAMLELLASKEGTPAGKLSGKDRVIIIGSERPESLDTVSMIRQDQIVGHASSDQSTNNHAIDTRTIYLAALGDILLSESIRRPVWIDPASDESPVELGSDLWDKLVSESDAVIWVGGEGITEADFGDAPGLIDARKIFDKDVRPALAANNIPDVSGSGQLQAIYTGVIPVVYKAQRTLLSSLVRSIGMAFVLIALVMIVLLNPGRFPFSFLRPRNFGTGLAAGSLAMIPNVFPVLLIFGLMGHRGDLVDIGTMMTASVAMGVAVDDTIHFLSWFRAYLDKGMDRVDAVIQTYRRVGPAMTQTTIVGGLGLFVFALSTFTPTQRFGTLMLVLLAAALIGDLVLLPALLAGPLGKCFKRRESSIGSESDDDSDPTS
ncbi:MAG: MMPL family transporter, partial [Pirellulaceae bacterium]|nr:MMPL family transporter [Pirellulaceae bacterium]